MADVDISYKGDTIAQMNTDGTKTLRTGGCYCEGDVVITYTPRTDDRLRHWDVAVTGEIVSNRVTILQDDWLKAHRADANLCVAIIPKFTIEHSATVHQQGLYLATNSSLVKDSAGNTYKSMGCYMHTNGNPIVRMRKNNLTVDSGLDVGDLQITAAGELRAVSYGTYVVPAGEYCVTAWLM